MNKNIFVTPISDKTISKIVLELMKNEWFAEFSYGSEAMDFFKVTIDEYNAVIKDEFLPYIYDEAKKCVDILLKKSIRQNIVLYDEKDFTYSYLRRVSYKEKDWWLYDYNWDELMSDWTIKIKSRKNETRGQFWAWAYTKEELKLVNEKNAVRYIAEEKHKKKVDKARGKVTEEDLKKLGYL